MKIFKIFFTMAVLALAACSDDLPIPTNPDAGQLPDRPTVVVPIDMPIANEDGNAASRAFEDSETGVDATIHDVWVMQFERTLVDAAATDNDAVADDAQLIYWDYIPEYDATDPAKSRVTLAESTHPCFVVALANMLDPSFGSRFNLRLTYGELRQWTTKADSQEQLFSQMAPFNDDATFPDNAKQVIHFNGITPLRSGVNSSTPALSVPLKRNIARITIDIAIGSKLKGMDFTIDEMVLCDAPDASYMLTNGNWREDFTNGCTNFTNEDGTPTIFPGPFAHVMFEPIIPDSRPAGVDARAIFYTPANQSGRYTPTPGRNDAKYKGIYTPGYAIYFLMKAHYTDPDDGAVCPVLYKIYLGESLGGSDSDADYQHDFNIIPNHAYAYTINLNNIGDGEGDWRVEDYGTVTFPNTYTDDSSELSNCYILIPSEVPGYARHYMIPVARVDEFWGNPMLGYDDMHQNNCLSEGNQWVVDIVWSDFNIDDLNATLPEGQGFGFVGDTYTGIGKNGYFTVQVPHGLTGNVVVGLKKISGDIISEYLWSWHLWITDYDPDKEVVINDEMYLYHVPNGNLCRLDGDAWTSGTYKNAVMMDRFVGATCRPEPEYGPTCYNSGTHYQYGFKTPYKSGTIYRGGTLASTVGGETYPYDSSKGDEMIYYSIAHPGTRFTHKSNDRLSNNTPGRMLNNTDENVWFDPRNKLEDYPGNGKKSIFDPSPLGWMLPIKEAFNDTRDEDRIYLTTNYLYNDADEYRRGFMMYGLNYTSSDAAVPENNYNGLMYWPYNDDPEANNDVPQTVIYFPRTGFFDSTSFQRRCASLLSSSYNSLTYTTGSGGISEAVHLRYASCVRCVKILSNSPGD